MRVNPRCCVTSRSISMTILALPSIDRTPSSDHCIRPLSQPSRPHGGRHWRRIRHRCLPLRESALRRREQRWASSTSPERPDDCWNADWLAPDRRHASSSHPVPCASAHANARVVDSTGAQRPARPRTGPALPENACLIPGRRALSVGGPGLNPFRLTFRLARWQRSRN